MLTSKKRFIVVIHTCISVLFLAQFSMQNNKDSSEKPEINISGTVSDKNGMQFKATNITIAGAYKDIVLYLPPPTADKTPHHKIKLDLTKKPQIKISYEQNKPIILKFNDREYLQIEVLSEDESTKTSYVLPRGVKLYFDEKITENETREHEVSLEEIASIKIEGFESQKNEDEDGDEDEKENEKTKNTSQQKKKVHRVSAYRSEKNIKIT